MLSRRHRLDPPCLPNALSRRTRTGRRDDFAHAHESGNACAGAARRILCRAGPRSYPMRGAAAPEASAAPAQNPSTRDARHDRHRGRRGSGRCAGATLIQSVRAPSERAFCRHYGPKDRPQVVRAGIRSKRCRCADWSKSAHLPRLFRIRRALASRLIASRAAVHRRRCAGLQSRPEARLRRRTDRPSVLGLGVAAGTHRENRPKRRRMPALLPSNRPHEASGVPVTFVGHPRAQAAASASLRVAKCARSSGLASRSRCSRCCQAVASRARHACGAAAARGRRAARGQARCALSGAAATRDASPEATLYRLHLDQPRQMPRRHVNARGRCRAR